MKCLPPYQQIHLSQSISGTVLCHVWRLNHQRNLFIHLLHWILASWVISLLVLLMLILLTVIVIIIVIDVTMFIMHSHCQRSPGSLDECCQPNQSAWATGLPVGSYSVYIRHRQLITPPAVGGWDCFRAISFSVSVSARLRENGRTDLHEFFREGVEWPWDDLLKFWVNSGKWVGGSKVNLFVITGHSSEDWR